MVPLLSFIHYLLDVVWWVIIISAVLSWLLALNVINRHNQVVWSIWDTLYKVTEPIYRPIRRILPNTGAIDFAPLVALLAVIFLQHVVIRGWLIPLFQ